jgi:hypothetical protein
MTMLLVYLAGFGSGATVGFLIFRSRLNLYKYVINSRLSKVSQQLIGSQGATMQRTPRHAA